MIAELPHGFKVQELTLLVQELTALVQKLTLSVQELTELVQGSEPHTASGSLIYGVKQFNLEPAA